MTTILARIAKAIAAELGRQDMESEPFAIGDDLRVDYLDQTDVDLGAVARAVLEAIREPSDEMYVAALELGQLASADDHWRTMIDFALSETTTHQPEE